MWRTSDDSSEVFLIPWTSLEKDSVMAVFFLLLLAVLVTKRDAVLGQTPAAGNVLYITFYI